MDTMPRNRWIEDFHKSPLRFWALRLICSLPHCKHSSQCMTHYILLNESIRRILSLKISMEGDNDRHKCPPPYEYWAKYTYIYTYTLVPALDILGYVYCLYAPQHSKIHEYINSILLSFLPSVSSSDTST